MTKFATNDGRVHLAEPAHVNSSPVGGLNAALAEEWARATEVISTNPSQLQGFYQIVHDHSVSMIYTKACGDTDATLPESMYAHSWDGTHLNRKANRGYHPPVNIMQPDAWKTHDAQHLLALKAKYPLIEANFNDTSRAAYDIGGHPVVPGTHTVEDRASWNARLKAKMDYCNDATGYAYRCLNGLAASDTMTQFTPCIGMIEAAFGPLDHTLPNLSAWNNLAMTIWQSQVLGWTPWVYVKMNTTHNSAEWNAFRALSLPTAMLLDRGSLLYCIGGKEQTPPGWSTREYAHPWYNPGLGLPMNAPPQDYAAYLDKSGAYVKLYTGGAVLVNPSQAGVSVTLDGEQYPVDAQSGKLMRRSTTVSVTWQTI